ncbi:S8 family serine peptidase [Rubrivirga sp. IMCC43871]|uniref:S8 family serine peptidase n=1 Tax=Rubrivirga sp. IMCC43871 TaxID=3391575 RepID=UPI00398F98DF
MRSLATLALLLTIGLAACDSGWDSSTEPSAVAPAASLGIPVDSVDLYVEFVEGVMDPEAASDEAFEGQDVRRRPYVRDDRPGVGVTVALSDYTMLLAVLEASPLVSSVELDIAFEVPGEDVAYVPLSHNYTGQATDEIPTGPFNGQMLPWNVRMIGGETSSARSGDGRGRNQIDVYVIDSGVDHPDVRVVESVRFFDDGVDRGSSAHGNHVAATIAASDDTVGMVGVAPGARIHSFDVFDGESAAPMSRLVAAVSRITKIKRANPDRPIVVNMSVGAHTGTTALNALDRAVQRSIEAGVVYVISAGNQAVDARTVSPARVRDAITVGAIDANGLFAADFSNHGPVLDLLAPGVRVVSAADDGRYARMDGTSMAAPHVAGAAVLVLQRRPELSPAQVQRVLLRRASDIAVGVLGTTTQTVNVDRL